MLSTLYSINKCLSDITNILNEYSNRIEITNEIIRKSEHNNYINNVSIQNCINTKKKILLDNMCLIEKQMNFFKNYKSIKV